MDQVQFVNYKLEPYQVTGNLYSQDLTDAELASIGYTRQNAPGLVEFTLDVTIDYDDDMPLPGGSGLLIWGSNSSVTCSALDDSRWETSFFDEMLTDNFFDAYDQDRLEAGSDYEYEDR